MKNKKSVIIILVMLLFTLSPVQAGKYYVLCEGNFGQANASLWSIDESLQNLEGPLIWNTATNPLGDVGQSLTLFDHSLYVVMNGSHKVRVLDLNSGETHIADIDLPDSSPRYMVVHRESGLGYISSWTLSALLIVDLDNNTVIDTFSVGARPEGLLIVGDELFASIVSTSDGLGSENSVLRIDLSGESPEVTHDYSVIPGPGSMTLLANELYVTSINYNDAWESFSGTSKINLTDHTVTTLDHGYYTNFVADLNLINGEVYRTFGTSVVPLNEDLSLNNTGAIGNISGIYSHSIAKNNLLIGSSDFVAPDLVSILSIDGQEIASFNVGAFPSQIIYYSSDAVSTDQKVDLPTSFSLGNNYPNPFNPSTSIPFNLYLADHVRLSIYDISGRMVATLIDNHLGAGNYFSNWDGRNAKGQPVSSGIYHAILHSSSQTSSIKLNLIK